MPAVFFIGITKVDYWVQIKNSWESQNWKEPEIIKINSLLNGRTVRRNNNKKQLNKKKRQRFNYFDNQ